MDKGESWFEAALALAFSLVICGLVILLFVAIFGEG